MRVYRTYRASTMFHWIKQMDIFLIVCFMLGTTTAYNLPWWSHATAQNIDLSNEKPVILRRVERVAETDEAIKQENRDIIQLSARVGDVTMNTTQGVFISGVTKETQIEQNISSTLAAYTTNVTSKTIANTETITILPLIHVEPTYQNNKLNRSNFNKPLSFIIEPHVISESLNHTSFPATSSLPETIDLAPGLLNSTKTNAKTSVSLSSTHINLNCFPPAHIVGNVSTNKPDTLDGFKSLLNTNVSQDGLSQNIKDDSLTYKSSKLRTQAGNLSIGDTKKKEMESDLDGELEDNEQPGMFRKFLEKITINPDDMEPRETQDKITNSDILTALVFPIFIVVLVGVSLYTIHIMRSYFILRFPHRNNGQDPPQPPNNDDTDIPLDSITIPISKEQNEHIKVEISNEKVKEEIEETDLLKPVRPAPQLDNIKPTQKIEDKKLSKSSLRSFLENPQQDEKEEKTEEKIQHRSSFRNFLDEIMNDKNKPEGKLEEKERDLELEQHPTE